MFRNDFLDINPETRSFAIYPSDIRGKKYNPPVSDAHALETLPAIIHAQRMLLPRYRSGCARTRIAGIGQFVPASKRPCVLPRNRLVSTYTRMYAQV